MTSIFAIIARRWRWIAGGVAVLAISGLFRTWHAEPTPLPPLVARQLEQHAIATAVDTAEIHRLAQVAAVAEVRQAASAERARSNEAIAKRDGAVADSMATAAAREAVARDSATRAIAISDSAGAWQRAYQARTAEVAALEVVVAQRDTALALAELRASSIDTALARSEAGATRADSALAAVVKVAESRTPPCRILGLLPCPNRKAVMLGAAVVTAAIMKWPTASR